MERIFRRKGFTLIELLLVIGIIAILASIVIIAINPTRQLGKARDAQRRSDVNTILNAVYQYSIDHNGNMPTDITTSRKWICDGGRTPTCTAATATTGVNLALLTGSYLVGIPNDPSYTKSQLTTASGTYYTIQYTGDPTQGTQRIIVTAPGTEIETPTISVTR